MTGCAMNRHWINIKYRTATFLGSGISGDYHRRLSFDTRQEAIDYLMTGRSQAILSGRPDKITDLLWRFVKEEIFMFEDGKLVTVNGLDLYLRDGDLYAISKPFKSWKDGTRDCRIDAWLEESSVHDVVS